MHLPILTPDYCEQNYNLRAAVPDHANAFARWRDNSADARSRLKGMLDVPYGRGQLEKVDIFPARGKASACLLFIHGGYWRSLDKSDFSFVAVPFVKAGVSVVCNNYSLAPAASLAQIVQQNLACSAWLWRNAATFGWKPDALYVAGHSAGGHLTAMMLAAQWNQYHPSLPAKLFQAGMPISGVFDLEPLRLSSINSDIRLDQTNALASSPAWFSARSEARLSLSVGGAETPEFLRQTDLLAERWASALDEVVPMPGYHHFNVVDELAKQSSPLHSAAMRMMRLD